MQPKLEKIFPNIASSIAVKREITPYMDYPLHYHPEFEIIYVEKSYGIRLMGSHIGNFTNGDLVFISPDLPHVWKNDKDFYQGNKDLNVDVYVIHFLKDALKEGFFDLPELKKVSRLFQLGQQGISIKGKDKLLIAGLVRKVYSSTGLERLIYFLQTLNALSNAREYELLSTPGYSNSINLADTERINTVMDFILENFDEEICLDEAASLVHMNKSSFCRYFKYKTHKTFSEALNEIRIANACKLLVNSDHTITEVCYKSGYNNISHFNRQFKLITGLTASNYAKKYLNDANQTAALPG